MRTSKNFADFWKKVEDLLPQAPHIRKEDAEAWWKSLDADPVNDEDWHLSRLSRVGASESAILVAGRYGEPAPFGETPSALFDRKMMRVPLSSNVAMAFGHEHEPDARRLYEERMAAKGYERDAEGLEILRAHLQKNEGAMAFSPDDLFVRKGERGEVLSSLLVDYKSPWAGKVPGLRGEPDVPKFSYVVQLHHGASVCLDAGIPVTDMRLCYLDHPGNLARPVSETLVVFDIEKDDDLTDAIYADCQAFVEKLHEGIRPLPEIPGKTPEEVRGILEKIADEQVRLVDLSVRQKDLDGEIKAVRESMAALSLPLLSPGEKASGDTWGLEVSVRTTYKAAKGEGEALLEVARQTLDEESLQQVVERKPDMEKIAAFLEAHGSSLKDFEVPQGVNLSAWAERDPEVLSYLVEQKMVQPSLTFVVPAKLSPEEIHNPWREKESPWTEEALPDAPADVQAGEQKDGRHDRFSRVCGDEREEWEELDDFDDIPGVAGLEVV
ncbi:YqaJ viral recombinase family protein [Acidithiobacillus sp. IBUN Pt1247-S3]|uniref:YqaJ viral recombinase family protein n=1 Tax=Acidithiobacillus sp. IBUN Pt1247-S3 TaxID=3166642 RepID=UPI0034E3C841